MGHPGGKACGLHAQGGRSWGDHIGCVLQAWPQDPPYQGHAALGRDRVPATMVLTHTLTGNRGHAHEQVRLVTDQDAAGSG